MKDREANYEVVVIGAGNAGLAAAISAAESGARVAMLEKAPRDLRGGNTYFTTDYRFGWNSLDGDILPLIPNISANAVADMRELDGRASAYVCRDYTCQLPVADAAQLAELIQ